MASGAIKFKTVDVPRQAGELARLKIATGPSRGHIFVVMSPQITIGRSADCDVALDDAKASRRHARMRLVQREKGPSVWMIEDLGSSNGIVYRGKTVRQTTVGFQDLFQIGDTIFEVVSSEASTSMLVLPARDQNRIEQDQAAFQKQRERVRALGSAPSTKIAVDPKQINQRNIATISILFGVFGAFLWFEKRSNQLGDKLREFERAPAAIDGTASPSLTAESERDIQMFLKDGFRELREKNYLGARTQFENVLSIKPDHYLARVYHSQCLQGIREVSRQLIAQGKKKLELGKTQAAQADFLAAQRLLARDPDEPEYKEVASYLKGESP